jgi:hypothetical protein
MHALTTHSLSPSHICQVCIYRGLPPPIYRGLLLVYEALSYYCMRPYATLSY